MLAEQFNLNDAYLKDVDRDAQVDTIIFQSDTYYSFTHGRQGAKCDWKIYLVLRHHNSSSDNASFVEIQILPLVREPGAGLLAYLMFVSRGRIDLDPRADCYPPISVSHNVQLKVSDVIDLLRRKGRQRYIFHPDSEFTCPYWYQTVARDFVGELWIDKTSVDGLSDFMVGVAMKNGDLSSGSALTAACGRFY